MSWRKKLRPFVPRRFRSQAIADRWVARATGSTVVAGPFQGMRYIVDPAALTLPKLLGSYERELHGVISKLVARGYPLVVNVGAAEGYYAVGLARAHAGTRVVAFEMDERRRQLLDAIATLNGVGAQITVAGACDVADLTAALAARAETRVGLAPGSAGGGQGAAGTGEAEDPSARPAGGPPASAADRLLLMDVEGAEQELLDPARVPALRRCTILVELHPHAVPGVDRTIRERFAASHAIEVIVEEPRRPEDFPALRVPWYMRWLFAEALVNVMQERRPERMRWFLMDPLADP